MSSNTENAATTVGATRRSGGGKALLERMTASGLALLPVIVIAVVVGTVLNSAFLTQSNLITILQQSSVLLVVVVAESLILIVARFDLSLESVVGLAPMVGAYLVTAPSIGGSGWNVPVWLALSASLLVGVAVGAVNAFLVVRLRLNAFIVTLAMLILLRGLTLGLTNGKTLFGLPPAFTFLGDQAWVGIPVSVWVALVILITTGLVLRYHSFGRALYAVGGNQEAARAAGIRVERVIAITFVVGGLLAVIAGIMLSGRIASVTSNQGQNLIFTVMAASVIGGVSLNGGRGSMTGAFTGVLLLGVVSNILTLSQVASFWIDASYGAIILIALLLTRVTGSNVEP